MFRCNKGQASIEFILVTAIVFGLAGLALAGLAEEQDPAFALALVKAHAGTELARDPGAALLERIELEEDGDKIIFTIHVQGTPEPGTVERMTAESEASESIRERTRYREVEVRVQTVKR